MSDASAPTGSRWPWLPALGIALAAGLVYANSFSVPFLFDDPGSIEDNPSFERPWSLARLLSPPRDRTVAGRPVLNVSLAANYAWSGKSVRGYHVVNLAIHVLAAWTLLGLLRATLRRPVLGERFESSASLLALLITLAWTVHPLQTESVTYIVQRAESLVGLFYLVTLYAVARGASSGAPRRWYTVAVAACLLGMGTKEVMVGAPLIALLYDRTFLAGTFRAAWRLRRGLYAALFATWIPLAFLVGGTGGRAGSAGFGSGVSPWSYALTQSWAIARYLRLSVWPSPLVLDYDLHLATSPLEVAGPLLVVLALLGTTAAAVVRRPPLGFAGAAFFAVLAPSSSFLPIASQTMAEHRMYLPLASVTTLLVLALVRWGGRAGLVASGAWILALATLTVARNRDYGSAVAIWSDTVAKRPENVRAHTNLASAQIAEGRLEEAFATLERARTMSGGRDPDIFFNLGEILARSLRPRDAVAQYEAGLRLRPDDPAALARLAAAFHDAGRPDLAVDPLLRARSLRSPSVEIESNLGAALAGVGRLDEAVPHYEAALVLDPASVATRNALAVALATLGRPDDALTQYRAALATHPDDAATSNNLGNLLLELGRFEEATSAFRDALRGRPGYADAENGLAGALAQSGRAEEAVGHYRKAIELDPDHLYAHLNVGALLLDLGREAEAVPHYHAAVRLQPDSTEARESLAAVLVRAGRPRETEALRRKQRPQPPAR